MKNGQIVLNSLKLENTGLHKNLDIKFGKVTIIESKNANGKTTIENSISLTILLRYRVILILPF